MFDVCVRALGKLGLDIEEYEEVSMHTVNFVYRCVCCSGEDVIVRIARQDNHVFWGDCVAKYRSEADAMKWCKERLEDNDDDNVYVPRVLLMGVDETSGRPFLCMERVEGKTLRKALRDGMMSAEEASMKLMHLVRTLCSLPCPHAHVGSFQNGLFFDGPLLPPQPSFALFSLSLLQWSLQHLLRAHHHHLPSLILALQWILRDEGRHWIFLCQQSGTSTLCLCHGDLSLDNVMVMSNDKWALLDWEWCGVRDARDAWLETREMCAAMGTEKSIWEQHVPMDKEEIEMYDNLKQIMMGVSWAISNGDNDDDDEYDELLQNIQRLMKKEEKR